MKTELIEYHRTETRYWRQIAQITPTEVMDKMAQFHERAVRFLEALDEVPASFKTAVEEAERGEFIPLDESLASSPESDLAAALDAVYKRYGSVNAFFDALRQKEPEHGLAVSAEAERQIIKENLSKP